METTANSPVKRRPGRPSTGLPPMRRVLVTLDTASLQRAREVGQGNVSEGIRKSLLRPPSKPETPQNGS